MFKYLNFNPLFFIRCFIWQRKIIIFFTITYITSNFIQLCLFRISKRVIVIVYVIVELIDFVVATKRDAKSVTIPDETGKAR